MESIVGQTVSHYEFLEKLGAGGMGEIYKARDSRLNRMVAVKVLAPGRTRDPNRRRRFIQEAQAASALNHPNIITIHDILPEGDVQYMVMEHVSGKTLHQLLAPGRMPVHEVLHIATQMANALAAAHLAGIIHRDFKPANVMVTGSGLVKILDFGLAKLLDPEARLKTAEGDSSSGTNDPVTMTAVSLTAEGAIVGTVNYMSPEQAEGLKVDARSDIFSFGAVLYEMVTGHRAFEGDSTISTLSAVLRDEVKPIRALAPEVPRDLDDLISRCLKKNPAERWQSMAQVAEALARLKIKLELAPAPVAEPAASAEAVSMPPAPKAAPGIPASAWSKNQTLALLAGIAVVLIVAVAGGWWWTHRSSGPPPTQQTISSAPPPTAPPPAPAPTPEPDAATEAKPAPDAPSPIAAAPPPPTAGLKLPNEAQAAPPQVIAPKSPVKTVPAPPSTPQVAVVPAPHAPAPAVQSVTAMLRDGVPFRIALMEDVPLDSEMGRPIKFRVLDGLEAPGGVMVIAKGSVVAGSIVDMGGKRNFFGERSKVKFELTSAVSVDDTKISVRATPSTKGDSAAKRPFVTRNDSTRELKERNLIAASGTEYVAYVDGDQTVSIHK
ncbi:MAG TPA: serine/threonine-protein kinase [Bryobacteraceae bacterium]|nr:serine/threonine-protein kinase [Bryobacteraceae bacterium]